MAVARVVVNHVAFVAESRGAVDASYAAHVWDPDVNTIEAVHHDR